MQLLPSIVVKRIGFDVLRRVIVRTPVDTGRARGSWTISVNRANRAVLSPAPDHAARPFYSTPNLSAGFLDVQPGDSVVISNNLPYIAALEDGHSRRAPAGMVKVSLEEVRANMKLLLKAAKDEAGA
jgi:hypothetical protein